MLDNVYTGRPKEVAAARTVRNRGVRLIGSAHGNLVGLVRNGELNGLVGVYKDRVKNMWGSASRIFQPNVKLVTHYNNEQIRCNV